MNYNPEYKDGQVIVIFKESIKANPDFARGFGLAIGYNLAQEDFLDSGEAVYKTAKGTEEKAIRCFQRKKEVESAYRRDLRGERLFSAHASIESVVGEVMDCIGSSDKDYLKGLDEIIRLCEHAKKI